MSKDAASPEFAERLARIEAARAKRPVRRAKALEGRGRLVGSLFAALISGYLVIVLSRYARFHLTGMLPGETGVDIGALFGDLVLAMVASAVLAMLFNFRSKEHAAAKTAGMVMALFSMHMLVHQAPGLFTVLFSEAWVNRVLWLTDATALTIF